MRQGERKRKLPKDKHVTVAWKKRNEAREGKQQAYITAIDEERIPDPALLNKQVRLIAACAAATRAGAQSFIDACGAQQAAFEQATALLNKHAAAAKAECERQIRTSDYYRAADDPLLTTKEKTV